MQADVLAIMKHAFEWFSSFKALDVIAPLLAAAAAAWWLRREFRHQVTLLTNELQGVTGLLRGELSKQVGTLTGELRGVTGELRHAARKFDTSIKDTVEQVQPEFEAAAGVIDAKRKQLDEAMANYSKQVAASGSSAEADHDHDGSTDSDEALWAEMQSIWRNVKEWLDEHLNEAITNETSGRARKLAAIRKSNYDDVIIGLFNYGWLNEPETDLALELSIMYKQHRNRRLPVTTAIMRTYRRAFNKWLDS
jgi:methyl-accepting chemotaxis protein